LLCALVPGAPVLAVAAWVGMAIIARDHSE